MSYPTDDHFDGVQSAILQAILNTAADAIITIDHRGTIRHANTAVERMFGYSVEELEGQNIKLLMPSPTREEHDGYLQKYLETGIAKIIGIGREVIVLCRDGRLLEVDLAVSEVRVGSKRLFTGIIRDMTRRNMARDSAKRERIFAEQLVNTANVIIVVLETQGRIARINPFMAELTGYSQSEVVGQDWFELFISPKDRKKHRQLFEEVLTGHSVRSHVQSITTRDGSQRTIAWSAQVLHEADDVCEGVLAFGSDITDLKQAEAQIIAQERLAAIGQMVTGLAHESRNALQRAQAALDVLELDAEHNSRRVIHQAHAALKELQRLYEEVRNYAAPIRLETSRCNIVKLCQQNWEQLTHVQNEHSIRLRIENLVENPVCDCDESRIQQVLRNLLENALAVSPEQGEILVRCSLIQGNDLSYLQISIHDEGPGISKDLARQMFTPFFTTKTKGTGLGLAISQRIVEAHSGSLTVGHSKGPGAEVVMSLPTQQRQRL